jgi:hypothetical protein
MKMKRDVLGWRIDPSTRAEENALEYLFDALHQRYCVPVDGGSERVDRPEEKSEPKTPVARPETAPHRIESV